LGVTVADHPDPHGSLHGFVLIREFGFELRLADVMDGPVKPGSQHGHAAVFGSHVGMVIGSVKKRGSTIVLRYDSKNSAHIFILPGIRRFLKTTGKKRFPLLKNPNYTKKIWE
jgi:hypothetical protein